TLRSPEHQDVPVIKTDNPQNFWGIANCFRRDYTDGTPTFKAITLFVATFFRRMTIEERNFG
ncbi:MAG: hypothetical protein V3R85_02910, partial [Alphaproteobacteria bacterium]